MRPTRDVPVGGSGWRLVGTALVYSQAAESGAGFVANGFAFVAPSGKLERFVSRARERVAMAAELAERPGRVASNEGTRVPGERALERLARAQIAAVAERDGRVPGERRAVRTAQGAS